MPSLREVIAWPSTAPWPAWAQACWPEDKIATINTQQFPSKPLLNACSTASIVAVRAAGVDRAQLPQVRVPHGVLVFYIFNFFFTFFLFLQKQRPECNAGMLRGSLLIIVYTLI